MEPMKPNKEVIICELIAAMDFGAERAEALSTVGEKWQLKPRTFDRAWSEAKKRFNSAMEKEKQAFDEVRHEAKVEAFKANIMTKIERMEVLSQIARGEIPLKKHIVVSEGFGLGSRIDEVEVVPNYQDRKAAIAELNKMEGDYAPTKTDITSGGQALPPPIFQIILDTSDDGDV